MIADLDRQDDPWRDFHHTFLPGVDRAWNERSSYKTMNAVVMAATLDPQMPEASATPTRQHRDELPKAPATWKEMLRHPIRQLFAQASDKEINILREKGT